MGEKFSVTPTALTALGGLCNDLGGGAAKTVRYTRAFTEPNPADFTGLVLPRLIDPLTTLRDSTAQRWEVISHDLGTTGSNLSRAAWEYFTQDQQNAGQIAGAGGGGPSGGGAPAGPAVSVGSASALTLVPPPESEVDTRSIAEAAADWLADCNDAIKSLTGWDPIGEVLHEVAGNWMALKTIGAAYKSAATALDVVKQDLSRGTAAVDPAWDGRASGAFSDYSSKLSRGMEWEVSVGRLINRGLTIAADDLNKAALEAVRLIKEGLSRFVKVDTFAGTLKLAARFVPYAGQAATSVQVANLIEEVRNTVMPLIREIKRGVDAFIGFLDVVKDPMGAVRDSAQNSIDSKLAPYKEHLEKSRQAGQDLSDMATAVQIDRVRDQPRAGWDIGDRSRMRDDG